MDGYIGGFVSGIAQTIVGHPLDTIKTWNQNTTLNQPPKTFVNLWKGIQYPLIQAPLVCSISFGLYENIYSFSNDRIISGVASGLIRSTIITPLEYYKLNLQQQLTPIFKHSFKNMSIVALREMPSATIYYGSYHYLKEKSGFIMLSGSLAGVFTWFLTYPLDTIKTRLQTGTASTLSDAIKQGVFWKGLQPCLLRAFITNGIGFYVYEKILANIQHTIEPQ